MKLTVLIENTAPEQFNPEHGLSVYIEKGERTYLLDAGASDKFLENVDAMGVDLRKVDAAFLSHAHYDHSGGFGGFFARNQKAKLYLRESGQEKNFAQESGGLRYIGIPEEILSHHSERMCFVSGDMEVEPGVYLIGHHTPGMEQRGIKAHMYRESGGELVPDDFSHEHSLVLDSSEGLVILNSCCHAGVDTVIRECMEALPGKKVAAVIGGFHLMALGGDKTMAGTPEDVRALAERLKKTGAQRLYTGHCTGEPAFAILKEELGDMLHRLTTGMVIELKD